MRIERDGSGCAMLHVQAPKHRLVLLQGILELYENLAIVRTVDERKSLISIVTTEDLLSDCLAVLNSLAPLIGEISIGGALHESAGPLSPDGEEETDLC